MDALHADGLYADHEVPVIVRGEGCYVYDEHGNRYLDGLSALYCVNIGHGRAELGQAAAEPGKGAGLLHELELRPPPLDRAGDADCGARAGEPQPRVLHFGGLGGGGVGVEAGEGLPRGTRRTGAPQDRLAQAGYHGTSMGALAITGLTALRQPFEPMTPGGIHVANTNSYRWDEDRDPLWAAEEIEEAITFEGAETVAAVILEPVQNGGGCFVPQDGYFERVREICDRTGCC